LRPESVRGARFGGTFCRKPKAVLYQEAFAHGFVVLSETATFFYKCDNFTIKNRRWIKNTTILLCKLIGNFRMDLLISDKDQILPNLDQAKCVW
jgi:dTDP-4-dehydrorhamnose 3,5-epimerase